MRSGSFGRLRHPGSASARKAMDAATSQAAFAPCLPPSTLWPPDRFRHGTGHTRRPPDGAPMRIESKLGSAGGESRDADPVETAVPQQFPGPDHRPGPAGADGTGRWAGGAHFLYTARMTDLPP